MKLPTRFHHRHTHLCAVLTTAAAFLLLGSIDPAFAKKPGGGGGGKPGSGDPPPPTTPPIGEYPTMSAIPIDYEIRSFDAGNPADWAYPDVPWKDGTDPWTQFLDINRDGVAVGYVRLDSGNGDSYAVLATVAAGLQDLNSVFADSLDTPELAGFHIKYAEQINAKGWVACLLTHPTSEDYWAAVGNIDASNSLRIIRGQLRAQLRPEFIPVVADLNENGDLFVIENFTTPLRKGAQWNYNHWLYLATDDPSGSGDLHYDVTPFLSGSNIGWAAMTTTDLQIAYHSGDGLHRLDLTSEEDLLVPGGRSRGIADDGSVSTRIVTKEGSRKVTQEELPCLWTPEGGLQPLVDAPGLVSTRDLRGTVRYVKDVSAALPGEGEVVEVLMSIGGPDYFYSDEDLEIYRADAGSGTNFAVRVTAGDLVPLGIGEIVAISRPNGSGTGLICGDADGGLRGGGEPIHAGIILTPIAP